MARISSTVVIRGGQAKLFTVNIFKGSELSGRTVAEVFGGFSGLVAVAVIRGQQVQLPKGMTRLEADDQILIAAGNTENVELFKRLAAGDHKV